MYAGAVLIGAGAAFGPSLGRVYAHDNKPFSLLPLRLAGAGVGCAGYLVAVSEALDEYETNEGLLIVGLVGFFAGTATVITTAVIDIGRAPKAVERYNQPAVGAKWQLRPAYFATSQALGANLSIEF